MSVRLKTERLTLREPDLGDIDGYAKLLGDPEVMRYVGNAKTLSREDIPDRIERMSAHWLRYGVGLFTLTGAADDKFVGRVGLLLWDADSWVSAMRAEPRGRTELEIGWSILREEWGRGYATEAALAVRDWVHRERGARRLISLIASENRASIHVAEKLGESLERTGIPGFPFTTDLYSLTL